ncbi:tRNA lysidine(34) synthetase TilS [Histidinibacterium lentulum]|uniref:tRNA(Ile)-lysidine synthase n=2 Tax=Histidinibacterium lentulum TaxID=2480588 RepID=A0A3N2QV59_9RHOB|nr:tRNA lysidine(34) synthetase TilS [Histidinibacterium lentulum]
MGALVGPDFPADLGLAVSGGGDSMAMLHLAAPWARVMGIRLRVATVDHGLRAEAAAEAALVADEARGLGLPHDVLRWTWDGQGNLMDAARRARLGLLGRWIGPGGHLAFAHTGDDLAETFLLRLKRGSGVEGLSAMAGRQPVGDWVQLRPLLDVSRADLRHYLRNLRIPFAEDPTNEDPAFDRARIRRLLDALDAEGLTRDTLAATARRLSRAREALEARAEDVARRAVLRDMPEGTVALDRDAFAAGEPDTRLRLFAAALQFVARADYRPRATALEDALDRLLAGGTVTLHGCMAVARGARLTLFRELEAVAGEAAPADGNALWDDQWTHGPSGNRHLQVRALGPRGLALIPDADRRGLPAALWHGRPALWDEGRLVAAPDLGHGPAIRRARRPPAAGTLAARLFSH